MLALAAEGAIQQFAFVVLSVTVSAHGWDALRGTIRQGAAGQAPVRVNLIIMVYRDMARHPRTGTMTQDNQLRD
jgi:hypothetical protein